MSNQTSEKTNEFSFLLAPSPVAGIGVFATHEIKKDTELRLFVNEEPRFIPYDSILLEVPMVKNFCVWYCVEDTNGYYCPQDFGAMDIGWYLNHSKDPNAYHKDFTFYALRKIEQGEEILIDYETLSEEPFLLKPIKLR